MSNLKRSMQDPEDDHIDPDPESTLSDMFDGDAEDNLGNADDD